MTSIADACAAVAARIAAAGIRATVDERDVNPPAVFVPAPAINYRFGGCWMGTWALIAVVPDAGRTANLRALGDLVDAVRVALDGEITDARPVSFAGVDAAPPLPGYALTYITEME
jgi:hypothetical protein